MGVNAVVVIAEHYCYDNCDDRELETKDKETSKTLELDVKTRKNAEKRMNI